MSKYFRYIFYLAIVTLSVVEVSCKKKTPEDIGLPILPGDDVLNTFFTDTMTLVTHTVAEDSLPTKNLLPTLLGSMNDPVFGISKASVFTQISLSATNPSFGANPVLDSAVLSLVYYKGEYYGALSPQKFTVYEVTQAIYSDSIYYSNRMLPYNPVELGNAVRIPHPAADSLLVDSLKYPPHLRIPLDVIFFNGFLTNTAIYNSNTDLQNFFKGFYITAASVSSSDSGAVFSMDMNHAYSRITLFYHNSIDTTSYYFGIAGDATTRFSHFDHDYSATTDIKNQLGSANTIQSDKVFIQPMAGLRAKVTMPTLPAFFNNKKVAINKAELIMPVDALSAGSSTFAPHSKLIAAIADSVLGPAIMPDYFEGATYFGGDYDATNKVYKFNIARYIQQVLSGSQKNQGLYIITYSRPTTANRVQLLGGNQALSPHMRLKITYSPVE